jgi:hypothetical protein
MGHKAMFHFAWDLKIRIYAVPNWIDGGNSYQQRMEVPTPKTNLSIQPDLN